MRVMKVGSNVGNYPMQNNTDKTPFGFRLTKGLIGATTEAEINALKSPELRKALRGFDFSEMNVPLDPIKVLKFKNKKSGGCAQVSFLHNSENDVLLEIHKTFNNLA